jgi:hypothetical protein
MLGPVASRLVPGEECSKRYCWKRYCDACNPQDQHSRPRPPGVRRAHDAEIDGAGGSDFRECLACGSAGRFHRGEVAEGFSPGMTSTGETACRSSVWVMSSPEGSALRRAIQRSRCPEGGRSRVHRYEGGAPRQDRSVPLSAGCPHGPRSSSEWMGDLAALSTSASRIEETNHPYRVSGWLRAADPVLDVDGRGRKEQAGGLP